MIEVVRNAFQHGGATSFKLTIKPNKIVLVDDGNEFAVESLLDRDTRSGGTFATKQLIGEHGSQIILSSRYENQANETVLALVITPEDIKELTPCTVEFHAQDLHREGFRIPVIEDCHTTYVVMPMFISYSDAFEIVKLLSQAGLKDRQHVVVSRHISEGVANIFAEELPDCRLMSL